MFHAEYSSGSPLRMLVDLRNVVDAALARTSKKGSAVLPSKPASLERAKAAAAGIQFASSSSDVAEFEVTAAPDWDSVCFCNPNRETTTKSRHRIIDLADPAIAEVSSERRAELGSGHGTNNFRRR